VGHEKLMLRDRYSAAGASVGATGASVAAAASVGAAVGGGASVAPQATSTIDSTTIRVVRAESFFISFFLLIVLQIDLLAFAKKRRSDASPPFNQFPVSPRFMVKIQFPLPGHLCFFPERNQGSNRFFQSGTRMTLDPQCIPLLDQVEQLRVFGYCAGIMVS